MRNLLALGAAALIGFAGIGWYLGWYKFETTPTPTGRHISIDVNTPKIQEDVSRGKEKLRDYLSNDDDDTTSNTGANPVPSAVTPAGYQRTGEGGFVIPSNNPPSNPPANSSGPFVPVPPSGSSPRLPTPR